MINRIIKVFTIIILVVAICGCASVKVPKVRVHAYIEDRARIDQGVTGNAGYIVGGPTPDEIKPGKPTRKVFVVEFTEEAETVPEGIYDYERPTSLKKRNSVSSGGSAKRTKAEMQDTLHKKIDIPSFDDLDVEGDYQDSGSFADYRVEKNDTLQKISKKFYGSYSKWPRIYEANKGVIKNPDFLKPGTVLRIPME